MVNALITSLLCNATPDDVADDPDGPQAGRARGLQRPAPPARPGHHRARARPRPRSSGPSHEMENRYRRFAGATARNIKAFNDVAGRSRRPAAVHRDRDRRARRPDDARGQERRGSDRPARPEGARDRHPHGARHAAPVGQRRHRPDQGQLPVSRIAFAMASQIDSRTILDAPGRRGPHRPRRHALPAVRPAAADAPPGRVRVRRRDRHGRPSTGATRSTTRTTTSRSSTSDEESTGSVDDLADEDADRLLPDAVNVIREYDRASASLLQRRLKIGYARAARIIDQLEARGYIGAFDGSNARVVLRRDDGPGPTRTRTRHDGTQTGCGGHARTARDADRAYATEAGPSLPERLAAARERKGVDLYRAERDTKIRARYLAALEAGDYGELPGAVYTKGFLRNYALYLGLDPEDVIRQWRRERGDATRPGRARPRGPEAARRPAPGPHVLAGRGRRGAADGADRACSPSTSASSSSGSPSRRRSPSRTRRRRSSTWARTRRRSPCAGRRSRAPP